jgi:hypothetical protein
MTKPVAWRYQRKEGWEGIWRVTNLKPSFETPDDWRVEPLFTALQSQPERDFVAWWMAQNGYATGHGDTIADMLDELESQVKKLTRAEVGRNLLGEVGE